MKQLAINNWLLAGFILKKAVFPGPELRI